MPAGKKTVLIGALSLIWLLGVFVAYYAFHKPFTPVLAAGLALAFWRLLTALALVSLGGGIGRILLRLEDLPPLTAFSTQAGLGLGIMALGVLLIGVTVGLSTWLLGALLLVGLIALRRPILAWMRQFKAAGELWLQGEYFGKLTAVMIGVLLTAALVLALAPPIQFDALVYHLSFPAAYLRAGRILPMVEVLRSGMPQNAEMLYTWAMALGGAQASATLGWVISALAVVGMLGWLEHIWGARSAWAGTAALLAGFSLAVSPGWAYVDWPALFFGLAFLVLFSRWLEGGGRRALILAGVFCGLAFGTKYTAGALAGVGGLVILWQERKNIPHGLADLGIFALSALAPSAPWLVKNLIATGDPLYPFFLSGRVMDTTRLANISSEPPWGGWQDVLLLPLRATAIGQEGGAGYGASVGPLLLGLGALAWLRSGERTAGQSTALKSAAWVAVSGVAIWAAGNRLNGLLIQSRLYYALFPAFVVLAAAGFAGLSSISIGQVRFARLVETLVVLALGLNVLEVSANVLQRGALGAALGVQNEPAYLQANLGWYEPAMQAVRDLPAGERTLLLFEPRGFYCEPRCTSDAVLDQWSTAYRTYGDYGAIRTAWRDSGYAYLLVYRAGVDFFISVGGDAHHPLSELRALDAFLAELPPPQRFGDAYELYSLR
jgi:hypothetical protein